MTPVVKSTSRPKWQRLKTSQVYYYKSPEHSNNMVLSLAFAFDREEGEIYSFALSYPYSYSRCMAMLKRLAKRKGPEPKEDDEDGEEQTPKNLSREIIRVETIAKSIVRQHFGS